jgi:hypothetical protein
MRTLGPRPGALSPLLKAHEAGILWERADERLVSRKTSAPLAPLRRILAGADLASDPP